MISTTLMEKAQPQHDQEQEDHQHPDQCLQIQPKKSDDQEAATLQQEQDSDRKQEDEEAEANTLFTSFKDDGCSGRERLQRHRKEVAGKVWIPDIWGQEELLKDWIDCSAFDACLVPSGVISARAALVHQSSTTTTSSPLRIENRC